MDVEEYRDIQDFPNYQVSNLGNVKNKLTQYILSPFVKKKYYYVDLNNRKHYSVARLVGQAFIPNPENKPTIDHIDRNRTNNSVNNLRWATSLEQADNRIMPLGVLQQRHISQVLVKGYTYYNLNVNNKKHKFCKSFKTLEEAITFRDAL